MDRDRLLRGKVPGVVHLTVGKNFTARGQGHQLGLCVRLKDKAALEAYAAHPAHRKVVDELLKPFTDNIIAALEGGTAPWLCPWRKGVGGSPLLPHNAVSGRAYNGINWLVLGSGGWLTFKQAKELGGVNGAWLEIFYENQLEHSRTDCDHFRQILRGIVA